MQIKVVQERDTVAYHFKSVADVNRFLFNKSSNCKSLGLLRMIADTPRMIIPDDEGFFRLFTSEKKVSEKFSGKLKVKIKSTEYSQEALSRGNLLLFPNKLNLFNFLVCDAAAPLEHLIFDQTKIVEMKNITDQDKPSKVTAEQDKASKVTAEQDKESKVTVEQNKASKLTVEQDKPSKVTVKTELEQREDKTGVASVKLLFLL